MPPPPTTYDESLARALPLPLAQLYRLAWNTRNFQERNLVAYYLWEAGLKLLASTAIVEYAERSAPAPKVAEILRNLTHPSTGHWWGFAQELVPLLAEAGDPGFMAVQTILLGKPRADFPLAAELHATLTEALTGSRPGSPKVKLADLFNRLPEYRNKAIGHAGVLTREFIQKLEPVLFPGVCELLTGLDVLAGRRLVYVDDVHRSEDGGWVVERYLLAGESPRRIEPLRLPDAPTNLPIPRRVYLETASNSPAEITSRALHPLALLTDFERAEFVFFNDQLDRQRAEYLCYTNNNKPEREELGRERRPLLVQVFQRPVAPPAPPPAPNPPPAPPVAPSAVRSRLVVLYKRNLPPDERLARLIESEFTTRGHEVFVDRQIVVGEAWVNRLEKQVREADAVIVLLSAAAAQSEMLAWEVQTADDEARRRGRPRLLPVRVGFEGPLPPELGGILDRVQYVLWTAPADDTRVIGELEAALRSPVTTLPPKGPPPTGAMALASEYYVVRPADAALQAAIARQDSIIKIKGARQVGKTSLLARGLKQAREAGAKVVVTDFQKLNASELTSIESFYVALAEWLAEQLAPDAPVDGVRSGRRGASFRFERFVCDGILGRMTGPLVWAMDEVDRLFACPYGSEVFGLVRSWHNSRVSEPDLPWNRLTLAITYATEAHLFISDMNQSPFNVGTGITLDDFTPDQVADLNRRYRGPLRNDAELERYYRLVGGHPFLVNRGLHELAARALPLSAFEAEAVREDGPFGDHLRRLVVTLTRDPLLADVVRGVIRGQPCPSDASFFRLRTAGVVIGETARSARLRCELYTRYLEQHL